MCIVSGSFDCLERQTDWCDHMKPSVELERLNIGLPFRRGSQNNSMYETESMKIVAVLWQEASCI